MPKFHIGVICSQWWHPEPCSFSASPHTMSGHKAHHLQKLGLFFLLFPLLSAALADIKRFQPFTGQSSVGGAVSSTGCGKQLMGQHWIQQQLVLQQPQIHAPLALGTAQSSSPFWFSTGPTHLFCSQQKSRVDFLWESSQQSDCCFGICRQSTLQAARGHYSMSSSAKREAVRINIPVQNKNRNFLHKAVSIPFH